MGELEKAEDFITIRIRLRNPGYWDKQGDLCVDTSALDWATIKVVPQLLCVCRLKDDGEVSEQTMCGACGSDWAHDWMMDDQSYDSEKLLAMLARVV